MEFLSALGSNPFVQNALMTGLLVSVACGVIGSYVVVRRITYIAGGIAHCVLGGIGAALYFKQVHGLDWLHPLIGAVAAALLAALIIGIVSLRAKQREDTVIGAVWAIGMATGVLFMSQTPGYAQDAMSYLFGDILLVARGDLWLVALLDVIVVAIGVVFYNQFVAVCFDEEFARLRGAGVQRYYLLLLCLTALTVVLLTMVVGIVLVIALLTLPVAVASHFAKRLWHMMILATLISMAFTTAGIAISFTPEWPAGATIIVFAGAVYLLVVGFKNLPRLRGNNAGKDSDAAS